MSNHCSTKSDTAVIYKATEAIRVDCYYYTPQSLKTLISRCRWVFGCPVNQSLSMSLSLPHDRIRFQSWTMIFAYARERDRRFRLKLPTFDWLVSDRRANTDGRITQAWGTLSCGVAAEAPRHSKNVWTGRNWDFTFKRSPGIWRKLTRAVWRVRSRLTRFMVLVRVAPPLSWRKRRNVCQCRFEQL